MLDWAGYVFPMSAHLLLVYRSHQLQLIFGFYPDKAINLPSHQSMWNDDRMVVHAMRLKTHSKNMCILMLFHFLSFSSLFPMNSMMECIFGCWCYFRPINKPINIHRVQIDPWWLDYIDLHCNGNYNILRTANVVWCCVVGQFFRMSVINFILISLLNWTYNSYMNI